MAGWTVYKGIKVPNMPLREAGQVLKEDLLTLADASGGGGVFTSNIDPTTSDDSGDGFEAGSQWLNTTTMTFWVCLNPGVGTAIWRSLMSRSENAIALIPDAGVGGSSDARALQANRSGDARGADAADFQRTRTSNDQVASGDCSLVIGKNCTASGNYSAAFGLTSTADSLHATASGSDCTATADYAVATGQLSFASGNYSTCSGKYGLAFGAHSFARGDSSGASADFSYANGFFAFADGYCSTASGAYSVAAGAFSASHGDECFANNDYSQASGDHCAADGDYSQASGDHCDATGAYSVANGNECVANADYSIALGHIGVASSLGQVTHGSGSAGYQQSMLQWRGQTTNGTQAEIFLHGVASARAILLPNRVWTGHLDFQGVKTDQSKGVFGRKFFVIRRDGSGNTSLVGSVVTLVADILLGSNSYAIDIDADDTNESLRLRVTGATSETVNWKCTAYLSEVPAP